MEKTTTQKEKRKDKMSWPSSSSSSAVTPHLQYESVACEEAERGKLGLCNIHENWEKGIKGRGNARVKGELKSGMLFLFPLLPPFSLANPFEMPVNLPLQP